MLRDVANARGYNAYNVQYPDWKGRNDFAIRRRMPEEDLTLVTGNWKDFRPMLQRESVHPGAISPGCTARGVDPYSMIGWGSPLEKERGKQAPGPVTCYRGPTMSSRRSTRNSPMSSGGRV